MRILVAVESMKFALTQIDFIVNHKWPGKVLFHVLNAMEPPAVEELEGREGLISEIANWQRERGQKLVVDVANQLRKAFPESIIVESVEIGYPRELILDTAEKWQADLIVVGSHGKRELARARIGSVSQAVLTYAQCSVVVIRPAQGTDVGQNRELTEATPTTR